MIPVPPLNPKRLFVFSTPLQSLLRELEVELSLREKQYEYYCNIFLTFPKHNIES